MKTEFEIPCANGKCTLNGCGINRASSSRASATKWGNQPAAGRVTPDLIVFQMHPFPLLESSEYQTQISHQHFSKFPTGNRLVLGAFLSIPLGRGVFIEWWCVITLDRDSVVLFLLLCLFSFCLLVICKLCYFYYSSSFLILIFNFLHLRKPQMPPKSLLILMHMMEILTTFWLLPHSKEFLFFFTYPSSLLFF